MEIKEQLELLCLERVLQLNTVISKYEKNVLDLMWLRLRTLIDKTIKQYELQVELNKNPLQD